MNFIVAFGFPAFALVCYIQKHWTFFFFFSPSSAHVCLVLESPIPQLFVLIFLHLHLCLLLLVLLYLIFCPSQLNQTCSFILQFMANCQSSIRTYKLRLFFWYYWVFVFLNAVECLGFCFDRFHLLVEFDEVKRSCRKRLDGHNRRRRKPQPDPLNAANLFTNHQGSSHKPIESSAYIYTTLFDERTDYMS